MEIPHHVVSSHRKSRSAPLASWRKKKAFILLDDFLYKLFKYSIMSAELKTSPYSSQHFACTGTLFCFCCRSFNWENLNALVQCCTKLWCNFQVAAQIQPRHPKCAFDEVSGSLSCSGIIGRTPCDPWRRWQEPLSSVRGLFA